MIDARWSEGDVLWLRELVPPIAGVALVLAERRRCLSIVENLDAFPGTMSARQIICEAIAAGRQGDNDG